jgi:hypothetical protein
MRRWLVVLLAGALAVAASLYLPWREASCASACTGGQGGVAGLLNLFAGGLSVDGWALQVGGVAALFALLLAALAVTGFARPNLADRLPLGFCALLVGYFGFALAVQARSVAGRREIGLKGIDFHYAYGAYVGVAGGIVALVAAAALRRDELVRDRSAARAVALVLAVGLLVSFLVPWQRVVGPQRVTTFLGIGSPAAVLAAVTVCLALVRWRSESRAGERLGISAAAALFTAAAVSAVTLGVAHAYGAWLGLALALALVALALVGTVPLSRPIRPSRRVVATAGAAALLLTALFLPWQTVCYPSGSDFGRYSGRCLSTNGWVTIAGSAAAALTILLVGATFARWLAASVVELTVGIGLLVATLGFELAAPASAASGFHFGFGSIVGFSATAFLVVLALLRLRPSRFDRNRLLVRLAPITTGLAYLLIIVLPWWDVLPRRLQSQSLARFSPLSWLTVAGALLAIHLLGSWARRIVGPSASPDRLVLLPLALLALAALDLIRLRDAGITWGGGIVVGLSLVLALLGRIEQREGLESLRVPELLRVDRL